MHLSQLCVQYFKTFTSFAEAMKELRARVEANLLKFPVSLHQKTFRSNNKFGMDLRSHNLATQGAAAKGGAQALSDPDEAYNWMVELMDETLERVDRAVDEGNSKLQKDQKSTFQAAQVGHCL